MSRRLFHSLCVLLLLIAQQGALVHATWHAATDRHARENHAAVEHGWEHEQDTQPTLCAFDQAFGQTLGGAHGAAVPLAALALAARPFAQPYAPRAGSESISAQSRGPPVVL